MKLYTEEQIFKYLLEHGTIDYNETFGGNK